MLPPSSLVLGALVLAWMPLNARPSICFQFWVRR
jgi:hypothetical protein